MKMHFIVPNIIDKGGTQIITHSYEILRNQK